MFEAPGDGGEGGLVTGQQVPVEILRWHQGTLGPADDQLGTGLRLARPGGQYTRFVQEEIDGQFAAGGIVVAGGVVPPSELLGAGSADGGGIDWHEELHVFVEGGALEVGQVAATEGQAQQIAAERFAADDGRPTSLEVEAHALEKVAGTGIALLAVKRCRHCGGTIH